MSKSRAQVERELEGLEVPFDADASYSDLCSLLKEKTKETTIESVGDKTPDPVIKPEVKKAKPKPRAPEVRLGVPTINDHEQRIFALEAKVAKLSK